MQCYRHNDTPAVAICRNCGKAACPACAEDTGHGVGCCRDCAEELREDHSLQERLKQSYGIGANPPLPASVPTYFFFGLILLLVGIYLTVTRPGIDYLTIALAAAFFVMAGVTWSRYRQACRSC